MTPDEFTRWVHRSDASRLYIAGPMTGRPNLNYPAFHDAARTLRAAGFNVINPARPGLDPHTTTWEGFMRRGIRDVTEADGVALLDGWDRSRGATLEWHVAGRLGMPALPIREWLEALTRERRGKPGPKPKVAA